MSSNHATQPVRLKLPPYGRAVMEARDGGDLELVRVFYGADGWQQAKDNAPALCAPAPEYEPGKYDWTPVAGLPVELVWLDGDQAQALAAELAALAAPVTVTANGRQRTVTDFLFTALGLLPPALWSAAKEADYLRREKLYNRFLAADLGLLELTDDDRREAAGD